MFVDCLVRIGEDSTIVIMEEVVDEIDNISFSNISSDSNTE